MEPDNPSLDSITAALVIRVVDDIDASSEERRDALLCDFLCAAWGSIRAQNQ
jgi:hypothetical protein